MKDKISESEILVERDFLKREIAQLTADIARHTFSHHRKLNKLFDSRRELRGKLKKIEG